MTRRTMGKIVVSGMVAGVVVCSPAWAADDNAALKDQVQQLQGRVAQLENELAQKNNQAYPAPDTDMYGNDPGDALMEMQNMQRAMDRMFRDSMSRAGGTPGMDVFNPRIDIKESPKHYTVTLDIPGMKKDNIEVKMEDHSLRVSGDRTTETTEDQAGKTYRHERSFGHFMRVVPLPPDARTDDVNAKYDNGVLTVTIGRTPGPVKPATQKITVK